MVQISNGICQYPRKYAVLNKNICHFLGPWPSVIFGKKIHSTETYTNLLNAALRIFFPQKTLMIPRFGFFFQDSRIRVKLFYFLGSNNSEFVYPQKSYISSTFNWTKPRGIETQNFLNSEKKAHQPEYDYKKIQK